MDNIFITILELFSPAPIFAQIDGLVDVYWKNLVPAIIVISIAIRYLELSVENLGQGARWSEAIKDVKVAIIFTALYAGIGGIIINFHQVICAFMYDKGSLQDLLEGYQGLIEKLESTKSDDALQQLRDAASKYTIEATVTRVMHFLSMILLALVNVLLRIIYAIGFCMLYVWGMFAVPTMSSKLITMVSGWFRGVVALLLWPLVEASMYGLTGPLFAGLAENIASSQVELLSVKMASISLIYTFANLLLMAIGVASFVVAMVISMNQNMVKGLGTSILTASAAGASLIMNGTRLFKSGAGIIRGMNFGAGNQTQSNPTSRDGGIDSFGGQVNPAFSSENTGNQSTGDFNTNHATAESGTPQEAAGGEFGEGLATGERSSTAANQHAASEQTPISETSNPTIGNDPSRDGVYGSNPIGPKQLGPAEAPGINDLKGGK